MKNLTENRRDFIKKASTVVGVGLFATSFGSVITGCESDEVIMSGSPKPPVTVDVDLNKLPINNGQTIKTLLKYTSGDVQKEKLVFIYRKDSTTFAVVDAICTHVGCELDLPPGGAGNVISNCPCHNVKFNVETGEVTVNPISWTAVPLSKHKVFAFDAAKNILQILM